MESNNYKYTVIKIGFKIRSSHNGVDQTLRFVGPNLPKKLYRDNQKNAYPRALSKVRRESLSLIA